MGGTDRMDQLNSYYSFQHKGIKWTHRNFSHFLGVSVVNASIIYNLSNPQARMSNIEFFDEVIKSLADLQKKYNLNTWHVEMMKFRFRSSWEIQCHPSQAFPMPLPLLQRIVRSPKVSSFIEID